MGIPVGSSLDLTELAAQPSTPGAAATKLYTKSDNNAYLLDSGGVERALLAGTVGGDNLLDNSNFLDTSSVPLNFGNSVVATETTTTWRNGRSIKITSNNATNAFGIGATATNNEAVSVRLQPSTTYTFSAWLYNPSVSGVADVRIVTSGTGLTTNPTATSTVLDTWIRLSVTFTTSATVSNVYTLRTGSAANPAIGLFYYAGAWQLESGTVPTAQSPRPNETGLDNWLTQARVATTANITLSGTQTIDAIAVVAGDRVLVKNQSTPAANGVYVVSAGTWARASDASTAGRIAVSAIGVVEGTANGGEHYQSTFKATDTLGTTAMNWYQIGSQVQVTTVAPASPQVGDMYYDTSAPTYSSSGAASLSGNNTFTGQNGFLALTQFTPYVQFTSAQTTSTPSGGSTTGANVFVRHKAKNVLAYSDYLGEDHRVQDALYANSWQWVQAVNNNATPSTSGIAVTVLNNAGAAATAVALASTNFYAGRKRFRIASTTTAATAGELRAATADSYISATANDGGFFFVARFGLNTVATNTRGFVGLTTFTTAYPAATNPGAGLNQIGFYWDTGMTTIHFINSSGTLGTSIDMGANFPTSASAATYFYEASIWMPAGSATVCNFSITRLNDALATATTSGSTGSGSNFPAAGTLLAWHLFYGNGSNAVAHAMDIQSVYLLSDN